MALRTRNVAHELLPGSIALGGPPTGRIANTKLCGQRNSRGNALGVRKIRRSRQVLRQFRLPITQQKFVQLLQQSKAVSAISRHGFGSQVGVRYFAEMKVGIGEHIEQLRIHGPGPGKLFRRLGPAGLMVANLAHLSDG